MELRPKLPRGRILAIGALIVWFLAVLWWAYQPVDDSVPTGIVGGQQTTQVVKCDSPLSGNDGPTEPLPSLPAPRVYEREPCTKAHSEYRTLFWVDTVLVAIAIAVLLFGVRRRPQTGEAFANSNPSHATSAA